MMLRIEMDRGYGWELRCEGEATATVDEIIAWLPSFTSSYPHRALLDGVEIATAKPKHVRR